jgi:HK97 gp10 family phage protein
MSDINVTFEDNSGEVLRELERITAKTLEELGLTAEAYAKLNAPVGTPESTHVEGYGPGGTLRNSIAHASKDGVAYVGSDIFYASYVELGTGLHAEGGKGRKTPWVWIDKNGKPHKTYGMKPRHFLKKAVQDHQREYKAIIENNLKNG